MPLIAFPEAARATVAGAAENFLDSLPTAATRAGYAATLARLVTVTGQRSPVAALTPEHYATVMDH